MEQAGDPVLTTNVPDRYRSWAADPSFPDEPTLWDAFAEGFTQAVEAMHDRVAGPGGFRPGECGKCGDETRNAVGLCLNCVNAGRYKDKEKNVD